MSCLHVKCFIYVNNSRITETEIFDNRPAGSPACTGRKLQALNSGRDRHFGVGFFVLLAA